MCAYYMSPIYQDVTARLLAKSGSVCLSLSIGKDDAASVHITLNPMQAKLLGKYLQTVALRWWRRSRTDSSHTLYRTIQAQFE